MQRTHAFLLAAVALSVFACAPAPRVRPVKAGPVDTGADSLESTRRQLKGTWDLVGLDLFSATGEKVATQATGRLEYDEFGNMSMRGTITGSTNVDSSVLNLSGRIAIDPVAHTFRFQDIKAASADDKRVDPQLDASHVRYYELAGDQLKTTVKNAAGKTTAVATWTKVK